jgi:hypothetical protein
LGEVQASAGQLKARTNNYIICATGVGVLIAAWMAVGQVTLGLYGWKIYRRQHSTVTDDGSSPSQPTIG